jgi:AraC-like DNA-binding protein
MKYYRVELGGIEPWMWVNTGHLKPSQQQWTQQPDHWTVFFLEHSGAFMLNNRIYPYSDGYIALAAPGMKLGFLRTGENTHHYSLTFGVTKRKEVVAIPCIIDLGDLREVRRSEFKSSEEWLGKSIGRGIACVHNLLWSIAQPSDVLRTSDTMYDFEKIVNDHLSEKLTVAEISLKLGISQSQLLRLVRAEYRLSVQEFIREKRTETARSLITSTDLPLKEIATRTGMADLQYFNKAIRSATGLSPRALRHLAINRTKH